MKTKKLFLAVLSFLLVFTLLPITAMPVLAEELPTSYTTTTPPEGYNMRTPPEYVFNLLGSAYRFILLDDFNSKTEDRYIMCMNYFGMIKYDSKGRQKFDTSSNDLAAFLNGDFLISGASNMKIPADVTNYINFNRIWVTEGGSTNGNCPSTYESKLGIGIISAYEYKKYCSRFGISDPDGYSKGSRYTWWTRTGVNDASGLQLVININEAKAVCGYLQSWSCSGTTLLRPTFYLKADFFRYVKIDVFTAGDAVLDMLNNQLTTEELGELYTEREIDVITKRVKNSECNISLINSVNTVISDDGAFSVNADGLTEDADFLCTLTNQVDATATKISKKIGNGTQIIPLSNIKNGVYIAHITLTDKNGEIRARLGTQLTVASKSVNITNPESRMLGVNSIDINCIPLLKRMGVKNGRWGIAWESAEKSSGIKLDAYDEKYNALVENGIDIWFCPQGANPLYLNDEGTKAIKNDSQIQGFANYVAEIAKRYPKIKRFEISNEPSEGGSYVASSEAYGKLVKACSDKLKEINPEIEVIAGAIALGGFSEFLYNSLNETNYNSIDGISVHPYIHTKGSADNVFESELTGFESTVSDFGFWKDLHISEMGWPTYTGSLGVSEARQAINLVKQTVYADINGYRTNLIYNFRDSGIEISHGEHTFGIVRRNFNPKPAYVAMLELYNRTDVFLGRSDIENTVFAVYTANGQLNAVCWNTSESTAPHVSYEAAYDLYGNPIENPEISSTPIYLCGLDESILDECVEKACTSAFSEIISGYASKLPDEITSLFNAPQKSYFDAMQSYYNIGSRIISAYKRGATSLSETDLLNVLYILNKKGSLLSEIYAYKSASFDADAIIYEDSVYVSGKSDKLSEVSICLTGESGILYADQMVADESGFYSFAFPKPEGIEEGLFTIRTGTSESSTAEEKTFALFAAPEASTVIEPSTKEGMLLPIASHIKRLGKRKDYTLNGALMWQCYFLNKWLSEEKALVSVTAVDVSDDSLMLTISNYKDAPETGTLIIGKYADASFEKIKWQQTLTVPAKGTASVFAPIPENAPEKLFFWKSLRDITPIVSAIELN